MWLIIEKTKNININKSTIKFFKKLANGQFTNKQETSNITYIKCTLRLKNIQQFYRYNNWPRDIW